MGKLWKSTLSIGPPTNFSDSKMKSGLSQPTLELMPPTSTNEVLDIEEKAAKPRT